MGKFTTVIAIASGLGKLLKNDSASMTRNKLE